MQRWGATYGYDQAIEESKFNLKSVMRETETWDWNKSWKYCDLWLSWKYCDLWVEKINWIGLRFKFPLLLHSTPSWKSIGEIDIERENKRWSTMENEVGYHDKDAITHFNEYNLREICRE